MRWSKIPEMYKKNYLREGRIFVRWVHEHYGWTLSLKTRKDYSFRKECVLYNLETGDEVSRETNKEMWDYLWDDNNAAEIERLRKGKQGLFQDVTYEKKAEKVYKEYKNMVESKWLTFPFDCRTTMRVKYSPIKYTEGRAYIDLDDLGVMTVKDIPENYRTAVNIVNAAFATIYEMYSPIRPKSTIKFDISGTGKRRHIVWPSL